MFLGLIFLSARVAWAQQNPAYDPPAGYYSSAAGLTGSALKSALHDLIDGHKVIPYTSTATDVWDALQVLDEDPGNPANVILVYNGVSIAKTDTNGNGNTGTSASWEREHCWPKSYGVLDTGPDTSDLFNLRACRRSVNASRNNRIFQLADVNHPTDPAIAPPNCPECLYDFNEDQGGLWTPRPSERGDLARAMFYMAVRYDGSDSGTIDLELGDVPDSANGVFGVLATLIEWSQDDPVSEEERLRNHRIYSRFQSNRNPFIDHPEMVEMVFGSVPELPALTLTVTPSTLSEGATAAGQVSVTLAPSAPLVVTLSKVGDSTDTEVLIPPSVTIPAGQTSAPFTLNALTDDVVDGARNISIRGSSNGYQTGVASLSILDIDENPGGGSGSIIITAAGSYAQAFDDLPASGSATWTDDTTLPGWYAQRTGSGTSITASSGSSTTGDLYSYGTSPADRALGSLGSGNTAAGGFAWGVAFQNATSTTVTLNSLEFTGEQWRYISSVAAQTVTFSYKIGTSVVSDLDPASDTGWTGISALDFTSLVATGTTGARDGNAAANRVQLSALLNLQLLPGEWITFRWRDVDHDGSDHGLAIDDFRIDWSLPPTQPPPEITSSLLASGQAGVEFNYAITADNEPDFFEAESLPDGLSIDGTTGIISGVPLQTGQFDVTLVAGNEAGVDLATMVLTVAEGETRFAIWSGGLEPTPDLLQAYAVGGAPGPGGPGEPSVVALNSGMFVLTAVVRVDDPDLVVVGEACADLGQFNNPEAVILIAGTADGVSQAGVPSGCQRQKFRIVTGDSPRWFMRLRIEAQP